MMQPQYLAWRPADTGRTATLATHFRRLKRGPYATRSNYSNIAARNTQVSLTSNAGSYWHEAVPAPLCNHRRLRCPRASHCWPHSALSQLFQHAPLSRKNMLLSHPSPSRLSQYTQASTSKTCRGQAAASVPTPPVFVSQGVVPAVWGASC
jgi:hypothetical protein